MHFQLKKNGISVGQDCDISWDSKIKIIGGGTIEIGKQCKVHAGAMILSYGGNIKIGDNCSINPYSILYGHGGLIIGSGVRIAAHSIIIPSNHNFINKDIPIFEQGETSKGIIIGNDVWIGAGSRILDGIKIGDGCVLAAGAVVTKNTDPYCVYGGIPAKKISQRI